MREIRSWAPRAPAALLAATSLAALLAACGGGGSDTTPAVSITSVKVMGDSLNDSGTFGFKFTIQKTTAAGALDLTTPRVYPELIANLYGFSSLCNVYTATSATTFVPNPTKTGCTNSAIGGGRINNLTAPTSPVSIRTQLTNASAAGNYAAGDLLIIDGGANDAADLIGAYLAAATDGGVAYVTLLSSILPPATISALVTGSTATTTTKAQAGGAYMVALADTFYASIKTNALDKGAQRIALLNMPGITNTPRFQLVLGSIGAAAGGGAAGAAAQAQASGLFNSWISAFNSELAAKVAGDGRVALVDFYTSFNDQFAAPAQFGLQDAKTPACRPTGVDSSGLPAYTFATCTDVALSALTPTNPAATAGGTNWWQTYGFSDSFHPTPQGHKNLAQLVSRSLAQAGWL